MSKTIVKQVNTTRPTTKGLQREWYVLDASKENMGRLATTAANLLMGKNRADFSKDVDMGAMLVIINSDQLKVSGEKMARKIYFKHSGRPGSIKTRTLAEQVELDSRVPLYKAIRGMLPVNTLRDERMNNRVFIFPGEHNLTHKLISAN